MYILIKGRQREILTHTREEGYVKTEAGIRKMQPQAKKDQQPSEAKSKELILL